MDLKFDHPPQLGNLTHLDYQIKFIFKYFWI